MGKNKIEPKVVIIIDIHNYNNIPIIVRDKEQILAKCHIDKILSDYALRMKTLEILDNLIVQWQPNTIIFEQSKLFIDKINRYPDPWILKSAELGFGLKISIDNKYHNSIPYILELPELEWRKAILNSSIQYSIDLYKSHIVEQNFSQEDLQIINEFNYYKAICLSESIRFDRLMDKKYQINKGD